MKCFRVKARPLHRIEAIVVKVIDYQECDKIIYVFTATEGMRTVIAKRARHVGSKGLLAVAPFLHAQFLLENPEKPLPLCREISPIAHYLDLRRDLDRLHDACKMAAVLYETLLPGKAAPLLFGLFKCYLDQMLKTSGSASLVASFFLKFLRHEGVFTLPLCCMECGLEAVGFYVCEEGFFCSSHAPRKGLFFSPQEELLLRQLMYGRQLSAIMQAAVNQQMMYKIEALFKQQRRHICQA